MLDSSTDTTLHNAYEELKRRSDAICMPCYLLSFVQLNSQVLLAIDRGHQFYAEGQWELALNTYTEALQAAFALGGDVYALSKILSNRSAAQAQAGRWQNSLEDAEQVIPDGEDLHKSQTPLCEVTQTGSRGMLHSS